MIAVMSALTVLGTVKPDFSAREKDWRNGAVVYQVFVDRFAIAGDLSTKRAVIMGSRKLMDWDDPVVSGMEDQFAGVWTHELQFWGGDLPGVRSKLDYIKGIGADVVYLTPIFEAFTNHKYDTMDYRKISPEFGTMDDLNGLIFDTHQRDMKIVLDGVFNHLGKRAPIFAEALENPKSVNRDWFLIGNQFPTGYAAWAGVANLPEWNLENRQVRDELWVGSNSVVQSYLKMGIDGWRLDVAFELGLEFLAEITASSHKAQKGSWVVGEISGYPAGWFPQVDGVFNFYGPNVGIAAVNGEISGGRASQMLERMVLEAGVDNLLKSWILTDNHDTARLASILPDREMRHVVQGMQFTLPGSPVIYYGTEIGLEGQGDPSNRGVMQWDRATPSNSDLAWVKKLTAARKQIRSLRIGDYDGLDTEKLIGYVRTTDRVGETAIILTNPLNEEVSETVSSREGRILSWGECVDVLSGDSVRCVTGLMKVKMPPRSIRIYVPRVDERVYRRIR